MESFVDFCKGFILDRIDYFVGEEHYACDFASYLTEDINQTPSHLCTKKEAIQCIKTYWDEAAEYWDYEKNNLGDHLWNPFDNPVNYFVCMVIVACDGIIMQCKTIQENWDDKIEFTQEIIDSVKNDLNNIYEINWC